MSSSCVINRLAISITAHAWNGDRTLLACCPNDNTILIYSYKNNEFTLQHTLREHDSVVTCLAWAVKTNRILSASQDRNAYVWRWENNEWKPTLVILRLNRAATRCAWSPQEDKFAVASGAKLVAVCYFEKEYDWWVSKHIKDHQSTVFDISWHPNNVLIATASSDAHVRVISAFVKGVDSKDAIKNDAFGTKLPFGTLCKEIHSGGWVHAAKWSPTGTRLAWVSHNSSVHVLECATSSHVHHTLKLEYLPFMDLVWTSPNLFVAAGYDSFPCLFSVSESGIKNHGSVDTKMASGGSSGGASGTMMSAWQKRDRLGSATADQDLGLNSHHQNCISVIQPFEGSDTQLKSFSTSGLDGAIAIWNVDAIKKAIPGIPAS
ncbi:actin-related protein 2/3 complex subunit 1-like [Schistocerca gregaria]|uniref:actin-related protein 2/3 complex subunit 1-like n=1 Tax=Schistocerca gregaria TaxID=7010 RepID=UPI00211EC9A5|nr:actin-related protein 2/3 complex subunit 1-like [Schistocerca gregaria]